jgi:hypothetical protein
MRHTTLRVKNASPENHSRMLMHTPAAVSGQRQVRVTAAAVGQSISSGVGSRSRQPLTTSQSPVGAAPFDPSRCGGFGAQNCYRAQNSRRLAPVFLSRLTQGHGCCALETTAPLTCYGARLEPPGTAGSRWRTSRAQTVVVRSVPQHPRCGMFGMSQPSSALDRASISWRESGMRPRRHIAANLWRRWAMPYGFFSCLNPSMIAVSSRRRALSKRTIVPPEGSGSHTRPS